MNKKERHNIVKEIVTNQEIDSQDTLLNVLSEKGFNLTQATLSRDIKELKIAKVPTSAGGYKYQLPDQMMNVLEEPSPLSSLGFVRLEFSGHLAVIKTRPGYAMAIAGEIDHKATDTIIGTVAGDDTILLIPKDGLTRDEVKEALSLIIPIS
jgi:transcriptional regulator of arginine metabolism